MLKNTLRAGLALSMLAVAMPSGAQERATFVLTNGERHAGAIVYGREDNNIVDGKFHLDTGGAELSFALGNVAVIDFAGGDASADAPQLPSDNSGLMILRNGTTQRGHIHNLIKGDYVQWVNDAGQRNNIPIRDVSRLYLNTQNARSTFLAQSPAAAAAQPPSGITIRVNGNQQWVDSGIDVRKGDQVVFYATGDINTGPGVSAGVAGSPVMDRSRLPLTSAAGGSLIGRIGNGAPFYIGWNPNAIGMPAAGRLQLGINDNDVSNNEGFFTVIVSAPSRPSLFQRR